MEGEATGTLVVAQVSWPDVLYLVIHCARSDPVPLAFPSKILMIRPMESDEPTHARALHEVMLRAYIYLRDLVNASACIEYCQAMGYRVLGIVPDPDGIKYDALFDAINRGEAEVIVVYDFGDLPADRVPRVEPVNIARPGRHVAHVEPGRPTPPQRRRPRPVV